MFLKNLTIENGSQIIRDIPFQKGVNLIIDETETTDKTESGNNVGKTTVLRLISFCLGGDGTNIYTDDEFKHKSNNSLIENFLKGENIMITLKLIEDIENPYSKTITIRKNFLKRDKKIQEIDSVPFNDKDFDKQLKKMIFKTNQDKPTFKQIIAKNIRDEKNKLTNTIKVLSNFTTKEEYETLYLFWLGIDIGDASKKAVLQQRKKIEEKLQRRLRETGVLSQIEQSLVVVNRIVQNLQDQKTTSIPTKILTMSLMDLQR